MNELRIRLQKDYMTSLRNHLVIKDLYKNDCRGRLLKILSFKISMMGIHKKMISGYSDYQLQTSLSNFLSAGIKDLKEIQLLVKSCPQNIEEKNDWIEETLKKVDPENKIMPFYKEFYQIILDSKDLIIN
jgi:hypothetical protein